MNLLLQNIYNNSIFLIGRTRAIYWGIFTKYMGKKVMIAGNCVIQSPHNVSIGDYSYINPRTTISGQGGVTIGKFVMIAANCTILSATHGITSYKLPMRMQGIVTKPVIIEDDVWIGVNVVILPGVHIGRGAIVSANTVVTHDVEPFSLVGGIPAKHIKYRFSKTDIKKAMKVSFGKLKAHYGLEE